MAAIFKLISTFLVCLCIVNGGWAACTLSDISVSQSATGTTVEGKPEYKVVIGNGCKCSQSNLLVQCAGFNSVESVNPQVIRSIGGDQCVVNDKLPVFQGDDITFNYAWDTKFTFTPVSSQINCS